MSNVIKAPDVASDHGAQEINQLHSIKGFETCQDIPTIKEELARLMDIMCGKNHGATEETKTAPARYWAIRWVMGWELEIPE